MDFVGNRTECALLLLLREWGVDYKHIRELNESNMVKVRLVRLLSACV